MGLTSGIGERALVEAFCFSLLMRFSDSSSLFARDNERCSPATRRLSRASTFIVAVVSFVASLFSSRFSFFVRASTSSELFGGLRTVLLGEELGCSSRSIVVLWLFCSACICMIAFCRMRSPSVEVGA